MIIYALSLSIIDIFDVGLVVMIRERERERVGAGTVAV